MSERWERVSEQTRDWPSAYVGIPDCSEPLYFAPSSLHRRQRVIDLRYFLPSNGDRASIFLALAFSETLNVLYNYISLPHELGSERSE